MERRRPLIPRPTVLTPKDVPLWVYLVLALLLFFVLLPLGLRVYVWWWEWAWPGESLIPVR